MILTVVFAYFD